MRETSVRTTLRWTGRSEITRFNISAIYLEEIYCLPLKSKPPRYWIYLCAFGPYIQFCWSGAHLEGAVLTHWEAACIARVTQIHSSYGFLSRNFLAPTIIFIYGSNKLIVKVSAKLTALERWKIKNIAFFFNILCSKKSDLHNSSPSLHRVISKNIDQLGLPISESAILHLRYI